ncbi:MAG: hypothetical protein LBF23_02275 [Endomicrobium sp.]|jgi:hypothetical protein|nr:hypothetical protein [Endomicrobium sp.]
MFYAECFILYHDSQNELISFVYPLSFQKQASPAFPVLAKKMGIHS